MLIFSSFTIVAALFAAIARRWDFPVPRSSDASCLFRMRSRRLCQPTTKVVGSSKEQPQNSAQQAHDHYRQKDEVRELAPGSRERSTRAAAPPNTRRRLSGWSSKIKTCCTALLPAELVGGSCTARLMINKKSFRPRAK